MNTFSPWRFSRLRRQLFVALLLLFFLFPVISTIGHPIGILTAFFLINLPAHLMRWIFGSPTPFFSFEEFGAIPQGLLGYGIILLFYVAVTFALSWVGNLQQNGDAVGWKEAMSPAFRRGVGTVFILLLVSSFVFRLLLH